MLGHKLWQVLSAPFETFATFRQAANSYTRHRIGDLSRMIGNVSADQFDSVTQAVRETKPDVIVNCVGIVKQDAAAKDPLTTISINSLFPHRLAQLTREAGARLIHLSTDCVF